MCEVASAGEFLFGGNVAATPTNDVLHSPLILVGSINSPHAKLRLPQIGETASAAALGAVPLIHNLERKD